MRLCDFHQRLRVTCGESPQKAPRQRRGREPRWRQSPQPELGPPRRPRHAPQDVALPSGRAGPRPPETPAGPGPPPRPRRQPRAPKAESRERGELRAAGGGSPRSPLPWRRLAREGAQRRGRHVAEQLGGRGRPWLRGRWGPLLRPADPRPRGIVEWCRLENTSNVIRSNH